MVKIKMFPLIGIFSILLLSGCATTHQSESYVEDITSKQLQRCQEKLLECKQKMGEIEGHYNSSEEKVNFYIEKIDELKADNKELKSKLAEQEEEIREYKIQLNQCQHSRPLFSFQQDISQTLGEMIETESAINYLITQELGEMDLSDYTDSLNRIKKVKNRLYQIQDKIRRWEELLKRMKATD
jgi:chromosome segregation ATPase